MKKEDHDHGALVKIGYSFDASKRLPAITYALPWPIELLAFMVCRYDELSGVEMSLHLRFAELREKGEWFRIESPLTEFIASLGAPPAW